MNSRPILLTAFAAVAALALLTKVLAGEPELPMKTANPAVPAELPADPPYSAKAKGSVTFNKHIAPILFQNCMSCHRPGEVAPFPITTYREAAKRDVQIAAVTKDRVMPPWKAEPGYGLFHDEMRLTNEQIGLIQQWVEDGSPEGTAQDLPAAPKFPEGWSLGKPDLVLKMAEECTVPAEGRDVYRCFVIPVPVEEDTYVAAVEYRPSNRKVVHHALFFLDSLGQARKKDEADPEPGFKSFGGPGFLPTGGLGGWAPGAMPRPLPEGVAKTIKKGSDLVLQIHFHPTGKVEKEQSSIGLYYAKQKPTRTLSALTLRSRQMDIPAGEKAYKVSDSFVTPIDVEAIGIAPHAHLLAKDIRCNAMLPDGTVKPLIWIKDWDFNWQGQYMYREPVALPKGTKVDMEFTYDNSSENPRNPSNPPKRVHWGEQTTDEMALCWVQVLPKNESEAWQLKLASARRLAGGAFGGGEQDGLGAGRELLKKALEKFDGDGDGKLNEEERKKAQEAWRKMREEKLTAIH